MRAASTASNRYIPKACPFGDDNEFWTKLRDEDPKLTYEWLERDLFQYCGIAVEKLVTKGDDTALKYLYHTSISGKLFDLDVFHSAEGF